MSEKYPNLKRTDLVWDKYMKYLVSAIDEALYMRRAQSKPMMTPRHADESHLTSRAIHLRETADIAKAIAADLGLNDDLAYVGMLLHDAGHPFSAHEGEVIFSALNDIYNVQYFHHNAKGLDIIWREGVLEDALSKIPNLTSELEATLRDEFYYFLDIVVSHDGEARKEDLVQQADASKLTPKEAVDNKAKKANSENTYKFIAQTPEGQVAKYSDAIAYLATDIQDAFRMGLLEDFDEEYLEIIGAMLMGKSNKNEKKDDEATRKEKIEIAKNEIDRLQKLQIIKEFSIDESNKSQPLTDLLDSLSDEDKNLIKVAKEIQGKVSARRREINDDRNNGIERKINSTEQKKRRRLSDKEKNDIRTKYLLESNTVIEKETIRIIEEAISDYHAKKNPKTGTEILECQSEENKIREFTSKLLGMSSEVIRSLTQEIQQYFIEDILNDSKPNGEEGKNMPSFSNEALDLMIALKQKNMRSFVINTKWSYQQEIYPTVALKMTEDLAANLLRSGVIRDKFHDKTIRSMIRSEEALKHMEMREEKSKIGKRPRYIPGKISSSEKYKARISAVDNGNVDDKQETSEYSKNDNEKPISFLNRTKNTIIQVVQRTKQWAASLFGNKKQLSLPEDKEKTSREKRLQERYSNKSPENKTAENNLTLKIIEHINELGKSFATQYMYTYDAIQHRIEEKVKRAFNTESKPNDFFEQDIQEQLEQIRKRFAMEFNFNTTEVSKLSTAFNMDLKDEDRKNFINTLVEEDRKNMEYKMAIQMVSDYLAGMTDESFKHTAISLGYLKQETIDNATRGGESKSVVDLLKTFQPGAEAKKEEAEEVR